MNADKARISAADARRKIAEATERHIMPVIKRIEGMIEIRCGRGEQRLTYDCRNVMGAMRQNIVKHFRAQGFTAKVINDQRDGDFFDIRW